MPKRTAAETLEASMDGPSPASKRSRVEDVREASVYPPPPPPPPPEVETNGHAQNDDIVGADEDIREELEEVIDELDEVIPQRQKAPEEGYDDLYLDTINRTLLDFDFEKLCSVTLSNINVYACLVCGKYFQGRGPKSQAYFHALEDGHHVYINMQTKKVYVLPEGYEVKSKSLDDIRYVCDPHMPRDEVMKLDKDERVQWDLVGRKYVPGFIGMNNIKNNDFFNVVTQALAHVQPLRNFFMLEDLSSKPQIVQRLSILMRKIWNPRAFKAHVSPHELLQEISQRSGKKFTLTEQADPVDFLSWFLNNLHLALGGSKTKPGTSIMHRIFQGRLKIESQVITARADAGDRLRFEDADVNTQTQPYTILTLDLPAAPLFQDELDRNVIPQVPLTTILCKYDGLRAQERLNTRVRYRLLHPLPPYLLIHIKRFSANKFVSERNPTIVTFSPRSLDISPYVEPSPSIFPPGEPIWYDLVANVTHEAVKTRDDSVEGEQERKVWRVQLRDKAREKWVQVQDLFVEDAAGDTLFTKESYLMVWERRKMVQKGKATGKGTGRS